MPAVNDLERYFRANTGRQIHKWHHYFEIYDRHLARFRGSDVHVLEFGVAQGGSMQMWKEYFGPRCRIYGVDKNPACKAAEEERVEIFIGDQEDRQFLRSAHGLHFYDSVLVIEKRPIGAPVGSKTGTAAIADYHSVQPRLGKRIGRGLKRALRRLSGRKD